MEAASTPTPPADPGTHAFVESSIEKLRLKLLDLTTRNPLIAFRHAARSRRFVRVIDELPDQLFAKLEGESGMRFRSLGHPADEPDDEKTVPFRRALAAARIEDPVYQEKLKGLGEDPGDLAVEQMERDYRTHLRQQLGMPPRRTGPVQTPADAARAAGLDPSFDLPAPQPPPTDAAAAAAQPPARHADTFIQTPLFEDDMQLTLARVREVVRLSLDEAGVNPLFCVFGFLEWYEDAHSSTPLHAPLLLLPLVVDRKLARGQYQYVVRAAGDEPQVNVAIAERLKRDFDLVLPDHADGETPEQYFLKVQEVIGGMKAWRLRRWISVGLFSFSRIAMYHDLAPERWQSAGGLASHPGLSRILGGGSSPGAAADAPVPSTADGDGELDVPLIADADSSQLAAIRDVLAGRSLVIEGPPGTGKSQTITNLIAAALAQGKTVLFVAEKMAALNVVRDRLAQAGLDDFCLELHSTKAGRKETAGALLRRLNRKSRRSSEADLQSALGRMHHLRDALARCVEALGAPAGRLGITVQELLWRCNTVRLGSTNLPGDVDELTLDGADTFTGIDVGRIVHAVEAFERVRSQVVASCGSVAAAPWYGIAAPDVNPIRAEDVVRRMAKVATAAGEAAVVLERAVALTAVPLDKVADLDRLARATEVAPIDPPVDDGIVARMAPAQAFAALAQFAADLRAHRDLTARIALAFASAEAVGAASVDDLKTLAVSAAPAGLDAARARDVPALAVQRQAEAATAAAVADFVDQLAAIAAVDKPAAPEDERALWHAADLAAALAANLLSRRMPSLLISGTTATLRDAVDRVTKLRAQRDRLATQFNLNAASDPAALRGHARAVRGAPVIPWVSLAWWKGKRAYAAIAKEGPKLSGAEIASRLDDLASFTEASAAYLKDEAIARRLGQSPAGIDVDITPHLKVAEWGDRTREALPAGDGIAPRLRRALFEGPEETFEALAGRVKDPRAAALKAALAGDPARTVTLRATAGRAAVMADHAARVAAAVEVLGLAAAFNLADAPALYQNVTRARALAEALNASATAKSVLANEFHGVDTDTALVERCTAFIARVRGVGLPPAVAEWLLEAGTSARLTRLREVGDSATSAAAALAATLGDLASKVPVDYPRWLSHRSPAEARAADLRDHAQKCATDPEGLHLLVDDERARVEVERERMGPLLALLEAHKLPLNGLGLAAKRVVYQSMVRDAISRSPALASFSGDRHETSRREFADLDHRLTRLRQAAIAGELMRRDVAPGSDVGPRRQWTDLALVENEANKQARHVPVRDLMDRAGRAIQQLTPCFMMSPLSIAQYLKPGSVHFDLVVMDEASQLRPEDAVGAIARGAQTVVVGDPKQLPPTNFFRESSTTDADDASDPEADDATVDEPSVLDQALAVLRPARRLKWHYRSRHASLIAFSNKEFYDGELVVFPSPYDRHPDFGLKYVHVAEGALRSRVNVAEVHAVAEAAVEYAARHPERSLGIVTLNQPQAELLSLEIDRLAAADEDFEAWRQAKEATLEPFFVKNLENVQGDERDAIFISTVYGPDAPGKHAFAQRFGPINAPGGHRRLNVLFTRAKCQTVVYSSMDPADLRTDETSPWGVRALKGFLKFAKDGSLDVATETGRPPESDFEVAVIGALRTAGFDVVSQVGVVGYFVDLAVRHPDRPGEFALGVECDGAMYHSSKSARDRDRLRQEVLERLGWRIHRIWSLDWYRNPIRERERLMKAVAEARAARA